MSAMVLQAAAPALSVNIKDSRTLAQIFEERSATFASSPFLVGSDSSGVVNITYGQCRMMAIHTSAAIYARFGALQAAAPIAILSDPSVEYVVLLIAAWYAAIPLVLVPTSLPAEVSQALVRAAGARVLLHSTSCKEVALTLRSACSELLTEVHDLADFASRDPSVALSLEQEAQLISRMPSDSTKLCVVLSTSGSTTGTSVKAVPLSHANILASCHSRDAHWLPERLSPADAVLVRTPSLSFVSMIQILCRENQLGTIYSEDGCSPAVTQGWLPLAHVMGLVLDLVNTAILHGGRYVLCHAQGHALPTTLLNSISAHRPSFVSAVPWLLDAWRNLSAGSPEVLLDVCTLLIEEIGPGAVTWAACVAGWRCTT